MARKSSHPKNSNSNSNSKKTNPDLGFDAAGAKVFPGEELPHGGHSKSVKPDGDEPNSKQKPKKQPKKETTGVGTEMPNSYREGVNGDSGIKEGPAPSAVEDSGSVPLSEKVRKRNKSNKQSRGYFSSRMLQIRNVVERFRLLDNEGVRKSKALALAAWHVLCVWMEKHEPLITNVRTKLENGRVYAKTKFDVVYPVVLKWMVNVGGVAFLISMVWLECAVRGVDSFLRMGTTSFFSVLWCTVFSMLAMVGIFKFLAAFMVAALVGLFIGFTLGILVLALSGALILWLYGSFWITLLVIALGGLAFALNHERVALLITTTFSVYCAWTYVGWLGLSFCFNLAFFSSDILIYFMKKNVQQSGPRNSAEQRQAPGQPGFFNSEQMHASSSSESGPSYSTDRSPGMPSTSGADSELTSEDEIVRLLNCFDHYSALGLTRFENVDASILKREYRKKAILVHPDKNMGNEKAVEAFKKLQNAYEVLLDSAKQKAYDDELRKEELVNIFRRFQNTSQQSGGNSFFGSGFARPNTDKGDPVGDSRRIACKKCNNFHVWVQTHKSKSQARWCQDCNEYHQAKDGDGWVEQSSQPFLFGLLHKVDTPVAFVCAESKIYDASEWYICQGMRCPSNTHKPSFHVNTSIVTKNNFAKGPIPGQRGGRVPSMEECVTEEDLFEWFQNAVQTGAFDEMNGGPQGESPSFKPGSSKKKKKGKKQW